MLRRKNPTRAKRTGPRKARASGDASLIQSHFVANSIAFPSIQA
jgi:hypothetical protein